ncbi:AAA family ATPase [Streptomyces sp. NPDC015131]|uniref:AAA family ATPase n=1 Tax=Streptomyces sp. NPDC015131 TaxID=3364941 RepID=UPI0036FAC1CC
MTTTFSQPAWVPDSGRPYPGAEGVAADIARAEQDAAQALRAKAEKEKFLAREKGRQEAEEERASLRKLSAVPASTIIEERLVWLWNNRIPLGELTLLAGRGGVGKSTLATQLAAWVTIGDMKGEFYRSPQNVLVVINEDNPKNVVVPRLRAAGADMDRVKFLEVRDEAGELGKLTLPNDIAPLRELVVREQCVLVILDPISSNLRGKKNDGDEMRPILERLRREIAEECRCAILGISHLRKGQSVDILEGIMGSSELGNVARAAMGVVEDPDDQDAIILSQEKGNMAEKGLESFRYRIHTHQYFSDQAQTFITTSRLEWLDPTTVRASDVLADRAGGGDGSSSDAVDWLRGFLRDGPKTRKECLDEGRKHHFGERKINTARKTLRVVSTRGFGKEAEWTLP